MTTPAEEPDDEVRQILLETADLLDQVVRSLGESNHERSAELLHAQSRLRQLRARLSQLRPTDS